MALDVRTHAAIDARFSGEALEVGAGAARVSLSTREEMSADDRGLVHGGFVFSLADYCAMLAVNEPNVVLASTEFEFLAPCRVGDRLEARAEVSASRGRSHQVRVEVTLAREEGSSVVARGDFHCVVTDAHVLERSP